MTDSIEPGEPGINAPLGPPKPEVIIDADCDQVVLTGVTARWLIAVLEEVQTSGRSESTDALCGDFVNRISDVQIFDVPNDEHIGSRTKHTEEHHEAA